MYMYVNTKFTNSTSNKCAIGHWCKFASLHVCKLWLTKEQQPRGEIDVDAVLIVLQSLVGINMKLILWQDAMKEAEIRHSCNRK